MRQQEALFQTKDLLYCGDNLDVLRLYQRDESVDLIYLDPPFKKHADYNLLFKELTGRKAASQVKAWAATWTWDTEAIATYHVLTEAGGRLAEAMEAFHKFLGESEMLAYLTMMAPRLVELQRVLKPTGSIYLHCDPAASHYLKMLMDAIFGPTRFKNEVVWSYKRYTASSTRFQRLHDVLLFYGNGPRTTFNTLREEYGTKSGKADSHYKQDADGRWFRWQKRKDQEPYKIYLSEGRRLGDVWDIPIINASARERLGYPTQKPKELLDRIIRASTEPGQIVLDPFCGCGTTVDVAQELDRRWIGIDITIKAIDVIQERLRNSYGPEIEGSYEILWEPVSVEDAQRLADERDKSKFERWAVRRLGGVHSGKRGADQGIDGRINFRDEPDGGVRQVIISVKAGATGPRHVRELDSVMRREGADLGVLISMKEPTLAMRREASGRGNYLSTYWDERYPIIQLLTVRQLLGGEMVGFPRGARVPGLWQVELPGELAEPRMRDAGRLRLVEGEGEPSSRPRSRHHSEVP